MATIPEITVEQLAMAFKSLDPIEKSRLHSLLPSDWFTTQDHSLTSLQKRALDIASEKEASGRATFHTWDEVEAYVTSKKRE